MALGLPSISAPLRLRPTATSSCLCPCCSARSFCDASDALGTELSDCGCSLPDPQLVWRIVSQVEFYLSDENLAKDAFLLKHVQKNKMGFVSIKLLTSFRKVGSRGGQWSSRGGCLGVPQLVGRVGRAGSRSGWLSPGKALGVQSRALLSAFVLQQVSEQGGGLGQQGTILNPTPGLGSALLPVAPRAARGARYREAVACCHGPGGTGDLLLQTPKMLRGKGAVSSL